MWLQAMLAVAIVAAALSCTAPAGRREATLTPPGGGECAPRLDHVTPARDSVGGVPSQFAWTPVDGADTYAIGVWTEVDVLVWRRDDLHSPSVAWPSDLQLEHGTYFWAVTALRGDRPLAESGRAAFVVVR
jgi:hypothetical protein